MIYILKLFFSFTLLSFLVSTSTTEAQFVKDLSKRLEIPNIVDLNSSETHLYVLSETEGLAVFRAHADSIQWLYTSAGMQQRGDQLESDIRFAYLYGDSRRLTVIEPTSVLGVYSSTVLPDVPLAAERIGNDLYIAMAESGLVRINLETPENVDAGSESVIKSKSIIDLTTYGGQTLFALSTNAAIDVISIREGVPTITDSVQLNFNPVRIFGLNEELYGSTASGTLYRIGSGGNSEEIGKFGSAIEDMELWNGRLLLRTEGSDIWLQLEDGSFIKRESGSDEGNYIAVADNTFWIAEYNTLTSVSLRDDNNLPQVTEGITEEPVQLKPINDIVTPYPRPVMVPIEFESEFDMNEVTLSYTAPFSNAQIRGKTLLWQPGANQTGRHKVKITAVTDDGNTDSVEFMIDVRSFNAPPRFTPSRLLTVPVGDNFEMNITAIDPDGLNQNLIRYLGVDMPDGAQINEKSGLFTWAPTIRQVGKHTFRIIATDQYGAASSQEYSINVVELGTNPPNEERF
ncbi:MAG: cadherin repeat domain-containing protein [Bacteroidetes bacterium]|jgi:hypothetical protein|nr:cadherin repeat domain-containing protein [Bacteroidota bacterium]